MRATIREAIEFPLSLMTFQNELYSHKGRKVEISTCAIKKLFINCSFM